MLCLGWGRHNLVDTSVSVKSSSPVQLLCVTKHLHQRIVSAFVLNFGSLIGS